MPVAGVRERNCEERIGASCTLGWSVKEEGRREEEGETMRDARESKEWEREREERQKAGVGKAGWRAFGQQRSGNLRGIEDLVHSHPPTRQPRPAESSLSLNSPIPPFPMPTFGLYPYALGRERRPYALHPLTRASAIYHFLMPTDEMRRLEMGERASEIRGERLLVDTDTAANHLISQTSTWFTLFPPEYNEPKLVLIEFFFHTHRTRFICIITRKKKDFGVRLLSIVGNIRKLYLFKLNLLLLLLCSNII